MRIVDIDRVPVADEPQDGETFFENPCLVQLPRWVIEEIARTCAVERSEESFCTHCKTKEIEYCAACTVRNL